MPLSNDVVYTRELFELAVRDDLLGPAEEPNELIKDMSVRDRYLVGKLAPRRPGDDQTAQLAPTSGADEASDIKEEVTALRFPLPVSVVCQSFVSPMRDLQISHTHADV